MTESATAGRLDVERLRQTPGLRSARVIGETASTNSDALTEPRPLLPSLLVAERQTDGRGRGGHQWSSRPSDLTFSLILDPQALKRTGWVSLCTGFAVALTCEQFGCRFVGIKWPNDVVVWDRGQLRKLAGVLVETRPDRLVIGVGVNVPKVEAHFSDRTSIADESGIVPDRTALLSELVSRTIDAVTSGNRSALHQQIERRNVLKGRAVAADVGRGLAGGIDPSGRLEVVSDDGDRRLVSSGSVRLLPDTSHD